MLRGLATAVSMIIRSAVDSELEPLKQELERAYARLKAMSPGDDASEAVLLEIERLERQLLDRYTEYVEKRDSTLPPKRPSERVTR